MCGLILHIICLLHINNIHLHTLSFQVCISNFLLHRRDLGGPVSSHWWTWRASLANWGLRPADVLYLESILLGKIIFYLTNEIGRFHVRTQLYKFSLKLVLKSNRWSTLQHGKNQWGLVAITSFIQISTPYRPQSSPLLIVSLMWRSNASLLFHCILLLWRDTSLYPWFCQL